MEEKQEEMPTKTFLMATSSNDYTWNKRHTNTEPRKLTWSKLTAKQQLIFEIRCRHNNQKYHANHLS